MNSAHTGDTDFDLWLCKTNCATKQNKTGPQTDYPNKKFSQTE